MPIFISFSGILHIILLHQVGSSNPLTCQLATITCTGLYNYIWRLC
jgi:hypothetical protein